MTPDEEKIKQEAENFAKKNKKQIAKRLTDLQTFPSDREPVSVFMAGSPGAGKTESARELIGRLSKDSRPVLRIDPDDIRVEFSDYNGKNSHLFQGAASIIADKVQDYALDNNQNFVFDGTFSNLCRSRENITRSIGKGRFVQIIYVYQEPLQAWEFVKARELVDGRHIPKESFIQQYFQARQNVNLLKKEFGQKIKVDLVVKNMDGTNFVYKENIDVIDNYVPERYAASDLEKLLEVL